MLYYLTIGVLFGITAGFAPGPFLTLVVSENIRNKIHKDNLDIDDNALLLDLAVLSGLKQPLQ